MLVAVAVPEELVVLAEPVWVVHLQQDADVKTCLLFLKRQLTLWTN